jgi:hypothetical protein
MAFNYSSEEPLITSSMTLNNITREFRISDPYKVQPPLIKITYITPDTVQCLRYTHRHIMETGSISVIRLGGGGAST